MTTARCSISIVDLDNDRFAAEVETPGCASVYPVGKRDFYSICGDGSFLHLRLDEQGQATLKGLLSTSASRIGDTWYFVSRENNAYAVQMSADQVKEIAYLVADQRRRARCRLAHQWCTAHRRSAVLDHASGRAGNLPAAR